MITILHRDYVICARPHREKKVQNSIFERPTLHGANIFQISFIICIIKHIFGKVCSRHIQLVLNIFVTSCPSLIKLILVLVLWACNQLTQKCIQESKSAFQIFLSETNEPKKDET